MLIRNKKEASKLARNLEKRDATRGLKTSHGQALDDLGQLAGASGWNALSAKLKPEAIDKTLQAHELQHIAHSGENTYGNECSLVVHTGFEVCYDAEEETPSYVRVRDPLGREIAYWTSDEWREDPELVMGALLGALARGRPLNVRDSKPRTGLPRVKVPKLGRQLYTLTLLDRGTELGKWLGIAESETDAVTKATAHLLGPSLGGNSSRMSWTIAQPDDETVGPFTVSINGGEYAQVHASSKAIRAAEMLLDNSEGDTVVTIEGYDGNCLLTLVNLKGSGPGNPLFRNWAEQLIREGKTTNDLDDLVHDVAEKLSSEELNAAEDDDAAEEVLDAQHQSAANINNEGLLSQIEYLVSFYGVAEAQAVLEKELKVSFPTR